MTSAVLDTEFTSFQSPATLSVGLVTANGAELYLGVDQDSAWGRRTLAASSQFVREVVARNSASHGRRTRHSGTGRARPC